MKKAVAFIGLVLACQAQGQVSLRPVEALPLPPGVSVYFTPNDDIEGKIVAAINGAKTEILFSQYAITDPAIAKAIVTAFLHRKIFVAGILEPNPAISNYDSPAFFATAGIPIVLRSSAAGINNNKFFVIDRVLVITGSYDCTLAAAHANDENVIFIREASIGARYFNYWLEEIKEGKLFNQ